MVRLEEKLKMVGINIGDIVSLTLEGDTNLIGVLLKIEEDILLVSTGDGDSYNNSVKIISWMAIKYIRRSITEAEKKLVKKYLPEPEPKEDKENKLPSTNKNSLFVGTIYDDDDERD